MWLPVCRARWRGRERRGQCLLLLTKGSWSSSPAERLAVLHPASPSRHRRAPRPRSVPAPRAARCGLRAGSGTGKHGDRVGGGREVQEGMQQGLAPAKPLLAAWELQDPRATSGGGHRELSPHLRSPRPRRAQHSGHPASTGRLSSWAVPFVYTLEDTQLRKHRRRHAVGNGDVGGASFGFGGCRVGFYPPAPRPP